MPDSIHYRKTEMDARYVPLAPEAAAYRVKTDANGTFLQLKDQATGEFRSLYLDNGVPQSGPGES